MTLFFPGFTYTKPMYLLYVQSLGLKSTGSSIFLQILLFKACFKCNNSPGGDVLDVHLKPYQY